MESAPGMQTLFLSEKLYWLEIHVIEDFTEFRMTRSMARSRRRMRFR